MHLAERSARSRDARRTQPRRYRRVPTGLTVPDGHKWCPDCAKVRPLTDFPRSRAAASGHGAYCLPCHNARGRRNRAAVGGRRTYHLARRYGITAAEADLVLGAQGGLGAICRTAPAAHVDHDHGTGAVRALLSFPGNGGLGRFRGDPYLLHVAACSVESHRRRQAPDRLQQSAGTAPGTASRPGSPPVGSQRRPGSTRSTGRGSGSRRQDTAGEADG
ncbi:endonuclease domain-containing protein [Geodermatophilus sp. SYSU D00742]